MNKAYARRPALRRDFNRETVKFPTGIAKQPAKRHRRRARSLAGAPGEQPGEKEVHARIIARLRGAKQRQNDPLVIGWTAPARTGDPHPPATSHCDLPHQELHGAERSPARQPEFVVEPRQKPAFIASRRHQAEGVKRERGTGAEPGHGSQGIKRHSVRVSRMSEERLRERIVMQMRIIRN